MNITIIKDKHSGDFTAFIDSYPGILTQSKTIYECKDRLAYFYNYFGPDSEIKLKANDMTINTYAIYDNIKKEIKHAE